MRRLIFCMLLMAVACGPTQARPPTATAAASSSPSPTPSTSGPLLFAVLEAKIPASPYQWNTVAIAGLDGYPRAKTTFISMPVPTVECAGAILPPSAHVAGDKVYFADGAGVVRSLSANGQMARVATFPFSGHQQMLSFAVSPDGSQLLGAVFTLPAKPRSWCGTLEPSGYSLDVYSAKAGGSSTLLYHESLPGTGNVMALFGWDKVGPFGTHPTGWASQGGGPAPYGRGSPVRIDANTGKVLGEIGSNTCEVWDMAFSGDHLCLGNPVANSTGTYDTKVSLHGVNGAEISHFNITTPDGSACCPFVAQDEQHVVVAAYYVSVVVARNGTRFNLGSNVPGKQFGAAGWLDSATVIGAVASSNTSANLAYVSLRAPGSVVSLGFSGQFLGTVNR